MTRPRGQSHVVGVVLLLGITTMALGGLAAVVGGIVDGQTASADEARVANTLDSELRPVEETGHGELRVQFSEGRLYTVERQFRILNATGVEREVDTGGLVYTSGANRVGFVGGSVLRGRPGNAWALRGPPLTVTADNRTLVVGVVALGERDESVSGRGGVTARLRTNVTHSHQTLPSGNYRLAVETATPEPVARDLQERGLDTTVSDLDGDGVPSVVAGVEGQQTLEVVVHAVNLEVNGG